MMAALSMALVACNGDYKQWAEPQSNAQEAIDELPVMTAQPTITSVDLGAVSDDDITVFAVQTNEQSVISDYTIKVASPTDFRMITGTKDGKVNVSDLNSSVLDLYGTEAVEREVELLITDTIVRTNADGFTYKTYVTANPIKIKVTPLNLVRPDILEETSLYMTGSNYDWGSTWVTMHQVNGYPAYTWLLVYLHDGEEFKFSPVAGWNGDFSPSVGMDYANSGITTPGNCKAGTPGWYILVVNSEDKTMDIFPPNIYLIGGCAGGWDVKDENLFTIPEKEDGKFVSPVFQSDANVRMCISIKDIDGSTFDWWRTEFVGLQDPATKLYWINYRGNGGDQPGVMGKAGQRAYIQFNIGGYCQYK